MFPFRQPAALAAASFPPRFAPRQAPLSLRGSSSLQPRLDVLLSCWPLSLLLCLLTNYFNDTE